MAHTLKSLAARIATLEADRANGMAACEDYATRYPVTLYARLRWLLVGRL